MVLRRAVRAVMLTPTQQILMMCAQEPASGRFVWFAPGGGRKSHEDDKTCLRRELSEETGLRDFRIGPPIWTRQHMFDWDGQTICQHETYYLVRVPRFNPCMAGNPAGPERTAFRGFRWWTVNQISASKEVFAPRRLAEYLRALIRDGPPAVPFDAGI